MKVFLLRHAHAHLGDDDSARPISPEGHHQIRILARHLSENGLKLPRTWWHSELRRARETGLLLNKEMKGLFVLKEKPGLRPEDSISPTVEFLQASTEDIFLIGHNPHLAQLLSYLLTGDPYSGISSFGKAHLYCLDYQTVVLPVHGAVRRWTLRWAITPKICRRQSSPTSGKS